MNKLYKLISVIVTICFLLNTIVTDVSWSLAPGSIFGNILGGSIKAQDISRLEKILATELTASLIDVASTTLTAGEGVWEVDTTKMKRLINSKSDSVFKPKFYVHEIRENIDDNLHLMCRIRDDRYGMRTYWAVFPKKFRSGDVAQALVVDEDEHARMLVSAKYKEGKIPVRAEEKGDGEAGAKAVAVYRKLGEAIDDFIAEQYAKNNVLEFSGRSAALRKIFSDMKELPKENYLADELLGTLVERTDKFLGIFGTSFKKTFGDRNIVIVEANEWRGYRGSAREIKIGERSFHVYSHLSANSLYLFVGPEGFDRLKEGNLPTGFTGTPGEYLADLTVKNVIHETGAGHDIAWGINEQTVAAPGGAKYYATKNGLDKAYYCYGTVAAGQVTADDISRMSSYLTATDLEKLKNEPVNLDTTLAARDYMMGKSVAAVRHAEFIVPKGEEVAAGEELHRKNRENGRDLIGYKTSTDTLVIWEYNGNEWKKIGTFANVGACNWVVGDTTLGVITYEGGVTFHGYNGRKWCQAGPYSSFQKLDWIVCGDKIVFAFEENDRHDDDVVVCIYNGVGFNVQSRAMYGRALHRTADSVVISCAPRNPAPYYTARPIWTVVSNRRPAATKHTATPGGEMTTAEEYAAMDPNRNADRSHEETLSGSPAAQAPDVAANGTTVKLLDVLPKTDSDRVAGLLLIWRDSWRAWDKWDPMSDIRMAKVSLSNMASRLTSGQRKAMAWWIIEDASDPFGQLSFNVDKSIPLAFAFGNAYRSSDAEAQKGMAKSLLSGCKDIAVVPDGIREYGAFNRAALLASVADLLDEETRDWLANFLYGYIEPANGGSTPEGIVPPHEHFSVRYAAASALAGPLWSRLTEVRRARVGRELVGSMIANSVAVGRVLNDLGAGVKKKIIEGFTGPQGLKSKIEYTTFNAAVILANIGVYDELKLDARDMVKTILTGKNGVLSDETERVFGASLALARIFPRMERLEQ
ncbi:MAG: hypothetical protein HQL28_01305, partial [Candidatus Omnitrophica bacterium]|nr:hypothetical protein [Candidatus Omnitrophota bacterium]